MTSQSALVAEKQQTLQTYGFEKCQGYVVKWNYQMKGQSQMAITKNTEYKIVTSSSDYLEIEQNSWSVSVYERSSYDNSITQSYEIQYEVIDELIEVLQAIQKEREEQGK